MQALKERLVNFYKVYDPSKLEDETKVNELVLWARRHSERALVQLIRRKYGVDLGAVDASEDGWMQLRRDITKYYSKHDKSKTDLDVEKIFNWTRQKGLAMLNDRLVGKYGVPLGSVKAAGKGGSKWKNRWKHVIANEELGNLSDELRAFYAQFDESQSQADIERFVLWGLQNGRDEVNQKLHDRYGKTLDDVKLAEGATADERIFNLRTRLQKFYETHDAAKANDKVIQAMAEWGVVAYDALQQQLMLTYGYDLDTKRVVPEQLKVQLFEFFSQHDPTNKTRGELEELVRFAEDRGMEALNQKLLYKYGEALPLDEEAAQEEANMKLLAEQTPKMSRTKSIRVSLTNALRTSLPPYDKK